MNTTTLVILAAGLGSRYGGRKQLAPVGPCGQTILEYSVFDALRAGFGKIVFVLAPNMREPFHERIGRLLENRANVAYVTQSLDVTLDGRPVAPDRTRPWGTGHAVLVAESRISGNFAVANADDFYGEASFAALFGSLSTVGHEPVFSMVGYRLWDTLSDNGPVTRAICETDQDGSLIDLLETPGLMSKPGTLLCSSPTGDVDGNRTVSMNLWGLTPAVFPFLRENFDDFLRNTASAPSGEFCLPDVIRKLIRIGQARVSVLRGGHGWCGITHAPDLARASRVVEDLVRAGRYPKELWS